MSCQHLFYLFYLAEKGGETGKKPIDISARDDNMSLLTNLIDKVNNNCRKGKMRISAKTRYALRAMLELAMGLGQGPIMIKSIAERQKIPLPYLEQILPILKSSGLARSVRGSCGGYLLARDPGNITLGEVMESVGEGGTSVSPLNPGNGDFPFSSGCVYNDIWEEWEKKQKEFFFGITLEDMVLRQQRKKRLPGGVVFHI